MTDGNYADRSRTYHRDPATSSPGYSVTQIVDMAYRRLNDPSLGNANQRGDNRLFEGILALRGLLDTINADPTIHRPAEIVTYTVPCQPALTWGLGGWDIDDQPPLEIRSMMVDIGGALNEPWRVLTEMSTPDLVRTRDDWGFDNTYPTRYHYERTWPVGRLRFDIGGEFFTAHGNGVQVTWAGVEDDDGGSTQVATGEGFVRRVDVDLKPVDEGRAPDVAVIRVDTAERVEGGSFAAVFGDDGLFDFELTATEMHPNRYCAVIPKGRSLNTNDGTRTIQLFTRAGGPPLEPGAPARSTMKIAAEVIRAFALPTDDNAAANYILEMPPGFFEYILTGLAIRLSSMGSKPMPEAVLVANQHAKYALSSQRQGIEHKTDLGFLAPRTRRRRWRL